MASVETVIFDLDGTVVDTIDLIVQSFQHAHRQVLGEEIPREQVLPWIGRTLADTYAEMAPDRVPEMIDAYVTWNLAHLEELQATCAGMADVVDALRRDGRRVAVATSKRREAAMASLAAAHLEAAFGVVVTMEDTAEHKPSPAPIRLAMQRLGAEPSSTVYVGDAVPDVQAAAAAGVGALAVTWGAGDPAALEKAIGAAKTAGSPMAAVCDSVEELREALALR